MMNSQDIISVESGMTRQDYIDLVESALDTFPDIKKNIDDRDRLIDWLIKSVNKNAVLKFNEPKQILDNMNFSNSIETGLNYVLGLKSKSHFVTEPIIDDSFVNMDTYSKSILEYKSQRKEEWQYLMYAFKCIAKGIEYDETKIHIEDNYDKYFSTESADIIATCPRCKLTDVDIRLMQLRSVDEAATIKYVCNSCEHSFNPPSFEKVINVIKI